LSRQRKGEEKGGIGNPTLTQVKLLGEEEGSQLLRLPAYRKKKKKKNERHRDDAVHTYGTKGWFPRPKGKKKKRQEALCIFGAAKPTANLAHGSGQITFFSAGSRKIKQLDNTQKGPHFPSLSTGGRKESF